LGSIKITIQKFYRIDGTTTQKIGVIPDVIIPDRYRYLDYGEKSNEFSLEADKIPQAKFDIYKKYSSQIMNIKSKSEKRIEGNSLFKEIEAIAKRIEIQNKRTLYTLNLEEYQAEIKRNEEDNKRYDELIKKVENLKLLNTTADQNELKVDELKLKIKNDWNKGYEKDIYIQEAINVLKDFK
jgi:carboxyl-terminal processing protease